MEHQRMKACQEILDAKLDEYIQTHKEWHEKGLLCPHKGNPAAHAKMDEIMEDVEQAHDMLHIAMDRAGITPAYHNNGEEHHPAHAVSRTPGKNLY